jgi:hypothetical protein
MTHRTIDIRTIISGGPIAIKFSYPYIIDRAVIYFEGVRTSFRPVLVVKSARSPDER